MKRPATTLESVGRLAHSPTETQARGLWKGSPNLGLRTSRLRIVFSYPAFPPKIHLYFIENIYTLPCYKTIHSRGFCNRIKTEANTSSDHKVSIISTSGGGGGMLPQDSKMPFTRTSLAADFLLSHLSRTCTLLFRSRLSRAAEFILEDEKA